MGALPEMPKVADHLVLGIGEEQTMGAGGGGSDRVLCAWQ
jgi:hypothetical protein